MTKKQNDMNIMEYCGLKYLSNQGIHFFLSLGFLFMISRALLFLSGCTPCSTIKRIIWYLRSCYSFSCFVFSTSSIFLSMSSFFILCPYWLFWTAKMPILTTTMATPKKVYNEYSDSSLEDPRPLDLLFYFFEFSESSSSPSPKSN